MTECYCDGGGSIAHEPSDKCTVRHPFDESEVFEFLTEREQKEWNCRHLLPFPGNGVSEDHLVKIAGLRKHAHELRRELEKYRMAHANSLDQLERAIELGNRAVKLLEEREAGYRRTLLQILGTLKHQAGVEMTEDEALAIAMHGAGVSLPPMDRGTPDGESRVHESGLAADEARPTPGREGEGEGVEASPDLFANCRDRCEQVGQRYCTCA